MTPRRIQMTRKAPWRADNPDAVIVARPSKWGNPFRVVRQHGEWIVVDDNDVTYPLTINTKAAATHHAVDLYRADIRWGSLNVNEIRRELAGRDLACWCRLDSPCHADVLLAIAGGENP